MGASAPLGVVSGTVAFSLDVSCVEYLRCMSSPSQYEQSGLICYYNHGHTKYITRASKAHISTVNITLITVTSVFCDLPSR